MLILSFAFSVSASIQKTDLQSAPPVVWIAYHRAMAKTSQEAFVKKQNRIATEIGICAMPRTCEGINNYRLKY